MHKETPCLISVLAYHSERTNDKVIRVLDFVDIDIRREVARIEQKELCERAGVHFMTYSRLKNRPGVLGASSRTLKKLKTALDQLVEERVKALTNEGAEDGKSN